MVGIGSVDEENAQQACQPFDTNIEILPGKRSKPTKAPETPIEQPMSKRKRRKLEQLAKKQASKELREQVLTELRTVQLTADQSRLMRASQSTFKSRRDEVAMAQRRLALGVPVQPGVKHMRWRQPPKEGEAPSGIAGMEGEEDSDSSFVEGLAASGCGNVQATSSQASPSAGSDAASPPGTAAATGNPPPLGGQRSAAQPAPSIQREFPHQLRAEAVLAEELPPSPASAKPQPPSAQPLQPVRVQRTKDIDEQRSRLPAVMAEQELVEAVFGNDVSLVCGDTGCGKSTQVPQFLYEAGVCQGDRYLIGVTQPRRVAAISVSQRVGQELNSPEAVGYQVRYDRSHCTRDMRIKFMTDGILLREVQADFLCKKYAVIIIDEAHERGVNCDILIGLLSRAVRLRRRNYEAALAVDAHTSKEDSALASPSMPLVPLRLVVMSATLRVCDFTENHQLFPSPPPVVRIDARTFPVTVHFARRTDDDYIKAAHRSALQIHRQLPPGTILIFVTGRHEVHRLCSLLRRSNGAAAGEAVVAGEEVAGSGEKSEADGEAGALELLEGSDDEEAAFDDDLGGVPESAGGHLAVAERRRPLHPGTIDPAAQSPDTTAAASRVEAEGADFPPRRTKRKRRRAVVVVQTGTHPVVDAGAEPAASEQTAAAASARKQKRMHWANDACQSLKGDNEAYSIATAITGTPRREKKGRKRCVLQKMQTEDGAEGGPGAPLHVARQCAKRKRRKHADKEGVADVVPPNTPTAAGDMASTPSAQLPVMEDASDEVHEASFRLDAEEDIVTLDPETAVAAAEDAKDVEAKAQKKIRMGKLDKSRTGGGAFSGAGFGEGPLRVYPLYAQLPAREQLAAFSLPRGNERAVIVATNVAETSVTLPNVRYVVDTGHEKRRKYRALSGVSSFAVERISKASADQRAGRAGRLGPGHAYRLYSAAAFEHHMAQFAPIAVLDTPMDPVLLLLASLGVPFLDVFPWPTPPPPEAVAAAIHRLRTLGALAVESVDGAARAKTLLKCTPLGHRLSAVPVAPRYAKMLLAAVAASTQHGESIAGHACALVAALSIGNLTNWEKPLDSGVPAAGGEGEEEEEHELTRGQREARKRLCEAQAGNTPRWSQLRDDADGLLYLMGGYAWAVSSGEEDAERFCRENRANPRQLVEAHSLMQQLGTLLLRRLPKDSTGIDLELPLVPKPPSPAQAQALRDCIIDGLVDRVAVAHPEFGRNAYVCADLGADTPVFVHCSSNVHRHRPNPTMLVFNEIISSSRPFMRDCISVDPMLLSKRAAAGDCPLLRLGEFLAVPAPRYLPEQDSVLAFSSPTYVPLREHALPTVEVSVPTGSIFRYKVFAKALLEGEVLDGLPPQGAQLLARPSLVLHAPNNPRVLSVVGPLWEHRVGSRAELLRCWREEEPRFLLEGYLKWLPPPLHEDIRISWPPIRAAAAACRR